MKQEQRSLLAIVLSVGIFVLWYMVFAPEPPKQSPQEPAKTEEVSQKKEAPLAESPLPVESAASPSIPSGPKKTFKIASPLMEATFSNQGAILDSLLLQGYYESAEKEAPLIDLVGKEESKALNLSCRYCNFQLPDNATFRQIASEEHSVTYRWSSEDVVVTRRYTVDPKRYLIDSKWIIQNKSNRSLEGQIGLAWSALSPPAKRGFLASLMPSVNAKSLAYQLAGSVERLRPDKKGQEGIERGVVAWTGLESRYFLSALISRQLSEQEVLTYRFADNRMAMALYYPKVTILPGEKAEGVVSVYVGPKEINQLRTVGLGLEEAIDYGWFSFLAVPILHLLKFFHSFVNSWGLAIILLTILVKALLNPLSVKGLKSMKGMQKLQPKLKELKEKYKDDKQRLNQETMHLFRTHKINPMGGCLPMVIQMPIYIALYRVLFGSIELFHAPFLLYKDLSAPDPYYVTPVLLGLFMFLQQKMTPSASADPMQKKMMMMMPIMFTAFMFFLPLGLIIYILVNTVMTVAQHWMFNKDIRWRDLLRGRVRMT